MKQETIEKRINTAIKRLIPNESDKVKEYCKGIIIDCFQLLEEDQEENEKTGRPYSSSDNLNFAISVTLDDMDTPMILKEARARQ